MPTCKEKRAFIQSYMECAMWLSQSDYDDDQWEQDPTGEHCIDEFSELARVTCIAMARECLDFLNNGASELIDTETGYGGGESQYSQAGHDFWLDRCGHGSGFWDGGWPKHGDALSDMSKTHGSVDLYMGDDGEVHQA